MQEGQSGFEQPRLYFRELSTPKLLHQASEGRVDISLTSLSLVQGFSSLSFNGWSHWGWQAMGDELRHWAKALEACIHITSVANVDKPTHSQLSTWV